MRFVAISALLGLSACATTSSTNEVWFALRSVDPVTSVERCTVFAPDRFRTGTGFTRAGALYPFIEQNSEAGLLVGVTSGGQYRIPPGDIYWRVDQNLHRTLKAADTPVLGEAPGLSEGNPYQEMYAGFLSSASNGVTAAGGEAAEDMLAEMRAGQSLVFRSATAAPAAGAPSVKSQSVGQYRDGALKPYPLDEEFDVALAECGIF